MHHHERWGGSGFPSGLAREQISPFARIIAIADTFYELVSVRPDRPAYMPHEAVEYILAYTGELFDPTLVDLFTKIVPLYPTGINPSAHLGLGAPMANWNNVVARYYLKNGRKQAFNGQTVRQYRQKQYYIVIQARNLNAVQVQGLFQV